MRERPSAQPRITPGAARPIASAGSGEARRHAQSALLVVTALYPLAAAWLYFVALADHPLMRFAYGAAKVLQACLPLLGWWLLAMERPRLLSQVGATRVGLLTGALLGGGVLAAWASPLSRLPALAPAAGQIWERLVALDAASPLRYLALALFLSVLHSWFEEYYWRWFLFGQLERRLGAPAAIALSSLAFSAHHWVVLDSFLAGDHRWTATLPLTLLVAAAGAVWAWLYERYGGLRAPWLSHLLVDAALMAVGYELIW